MMEREIVYKHIKAEVNEMRRLVKKTNPTNKAKFIKICALVGFSSLLAVVLFAINFGLYKRYQIPFLLFAVFLAILAISTFVRFMQYSINAYYRGQLANLRRELRKLKIKSGGKQIIQ